MFLNELDSSLFMDSIFVRNSERFVVGEMLCCSYHKCFDVGKLFYEIQDGSSKVIDKPSGRAKSLVEKKSNTRE